MDGIIEQNKETKRNSEVSTLWDIINFLRTEGHLVMQADFRIETINRLKVDNSATPIEFPQPKKILYLRYKRVFELYQMHSKKIGESLLSKSSLPFYMEHSPAYLGKKRSFRFKNIIQGYAQSSIPDGQTAFSSESVLDQAYCFDYDMIVELYGVNLDIVYGLGSEDEEKWRFLHPGMPLSNGRHFSYLLKMIWLPWKAVQHVQQMQHPCFEYVSAAFCFQHPFNDFQHHSTATKDDIQHYTTIYLIFNK